jgi:hypothetical protein
MDEWSRDPAVQAMRSIFEGMEAFLEEILERVAMSPYDHRIRGWLEQALIKFERSWGAAEQMGIRMNEEIAPVVYAHCLAKILESQGVEIPEDMLPEEKQIQKLIHEVCK